MECTQSSNHKVCCCTHLCSKQNIKLHLYTDTPKFHFNKFKQIWSKRLREQNWNGNLFLPRLDCNLMHCFINYLEAAFLSQIEISHHNTLLRTKTRHSTFFSKMELEIIKIKRRFFIFSDRD